MQTSPRPRWLIEGAIVGWNVSLGKEPDVLPVTVVEIPPPGDPFEGSVLVRDAFGCVRVPEIWLVPLDEPDPFADVPALADLGDA